MTSSNTHSGYGFERASWKYYNTIKKKAMEQEFSWSGLIISLSIAFFIVIASAQALSLAYQSIEAARNHQRFIERKVYYLENLEHIDGQVINDVNFVLPQRPVIV